MSAKTEVKSPGRGNYSNSLTGGSARNSPIVVEPTAPTENNNQNQESDSPTDLTSEARVSPVTLKLTKNYDTSGSMLEMVVEKVKARENAAAAVTAATKKQEVDDGVKQEMKRRTSNDSEDSSVTKASEGNTDDIKDEDDDNEEDEDKISPGENIDPERLKAFNMFVRLFVDENLDRSVPISKQPKDKIQAILEACDRQFAEFHGRSRKRVRTYLKSCRRVKKTKDGNGFEQVKQTPPHLTSAAAETILAQACENESQNAKRMRMGLEPLPSHLMNSNKANSPQINTSKQLEQPIINKSPSRDPVPRGHDSRSQNNLEVTHSRKRSGDTPDYSQIQAKIATVTNNFRPPRDVASPYNLSNGNAMFRPGFAPSTFNSPPAHHQSTSLLQNSLSSQVQNGPTDLSMKKSMRNAPPFYSKQKTAVPLTAEEIASMKSMIAGYRESAAYLYRSADELEQYLQQHQN